MPVDLDQGRFREQALRIIDSHVAQTGRAPDRAFDAADADLQPRRWAELGDAVDQETMPGDGVEKRDQRTDGEDEAGEQPQRDPGDAPAPAAGRADRALLLLHQKAWP